MRSLSQWSNRLAIVAFFLLIVALPAMPATDKHTSSKTWEYNLKNGLKLLVREDHRAPIVIAQIWYRIGSSYEHNGITGVSHVLEHMMFKGTEHYPNDSFSKTISSHGGNLNAMTSQDYTMYYEELAADRLAISFKLEADRMANLTFTPEQFESELRVVKEERRLRTEDNPEAQLFERLQATAFVSSPYHNPVIGWMNDLDHLTLDDAKTWYQKWYAPNNATVVVVGDVNPEKVHTLAQNTYGKIPRRLIASIKPQKEVPGFGERRLKVKVPAKIPTVILGYNVPVVSTAHETWEPYALDVLVGILDGGLSARLSRDLVRGRSIASAVQASYDPFDRIDTLFYLSASPVAGHSIIELEQALHEQVAKLRTQLVSTQELARVKTNVIAGSVYKKDAPSFVASLLGQLTSVGLDWRLEDRYSDNIQAITPEQLRAVAQKYLIDDHVTVAILEPQAIRERQKTDDGDKVHG